MARLSKENVELAEQIIARYPRRRSALIPLLHVAQQQDGWIAEDAMEHIAELIGITPAEVLGTCSFYEMFKRQPVGRYLVNVCTNLPCMLAGGYELLHHIERELGVPPGRTTIDGTFTLEESECLAACTEAPCLQVNYRYFTKLSHEAASKVIADLRAGKLDDVVPPHGTTTRVRQAPSPNWAGNNAEGLPEVIA